MDHLVVDFWNLRGGVVATEAVVAEAGAANGRVRVLVEKYTAAGTELEVLKVFWTRSNSLTHV